MNVDIILVYRSYAYSTGLDSNPSGAGSHGIHTGSGVYTTVLASFGK